MHAHDLETSPRESGPSWSITLFYILGLMAFTVVYRLVPYWFDLGTQARFVWNLTPVGALGLFAGMHLRWRWAFLVPLLALFVSDLLLIEPLARQGLSAFSWGRPLIYASFAVYVLLGGFVREWLARWWPVGIVAACLCGSVQFFLISNFLVWVVPHGQPAYPGTLAGLMQCYTQALPFFRNTLGGDILFTGLFFALHTLLLAVIQREKVRQPA
jgi:hypothetical protein